jgi:hypothetical protein
MIAFARLWAVRVLIAISAGCLWLARKVAPRRLAM